MWIIEQYKASFMKALNSTSLRKAINKHLITIRLKITHNIKREISYDPIEWLKATALSHNLS